MKEVSSEAASGSAGAKTSLMQGFYGTMSGGLSVVVDKFAGMPKLQEVEEAFSKGPLKDIPVLVVQNTGCIGCPGGDLEDQSANDYGHMVRCAEQMSDALHGEFVTIESRSQFPAAVATWMRKHFGDETPQVSVI